jgi:hypothetical protein
MGHYRVYEKKTGIYLGLFPAESKYHAIAIAARAAGIASSLLIAK